MLTDENFLEEYRTGTHNFVNDFYKKAFGQSVEYCRAVGYFRSSSLESFGSTLQKFLQNNGKIRLITSVELTEADSNAIDEGMNKQEVCENRIASIIEEEFQEGIGSGVSKLVKLLEIGRLEIKIALPKTGRGIYHEKVGLFFDKADNFLAFSGSANESTNAFENNYECIEVFTSWNEKSRAEKKREHFESLWSEINEDVLVFEFSEALKKKIINISKNYEKRKPFGAGKVNDVDNKWVHQEKAVDIFLQKERGLLNMATGTGKTRTSLKILKALYEQDKIDTIIVSTFGNSLLNQWYIEVLNLRKYIKLRIYRHFAKHKEKQRYINQSRDSILIISNAQLASVLKKLSEEQGRKTFLIYDEVHRLGAPQNIQTLEGHSGHIRYVLGLSATPDREYDEKGNKFIEEHVGETLMNFELKDAIRKNILAPFEYISLSYRASEEDKVKIKSVHSQKAKRAKDGNPMSNEEFWTKLSQVYKSSRVKQGVFDRFIVNRQDLLKRCIIFVDTTEYALEVLEYVHKYRSDFHTYLSGDDEETLKKFAKGELECLVACHRLSEGIDIQSLNSVILFSSDRARLETIQRVGRCLRTDPNNLNKIATVVDFIREESSTDEDREVWLSEISKVRPKREEI
jgi:superfamily II DNA or RNA helicase/HKD family nuclease